MVETHEFILGLWEVHAGVIYWSLLSSQPWSSWHFEDFFLLDSLEVALWGSIADLLELETGHFVSCFLASSLLVFFNLFKLNYRDFSFCSFNQLLFVLRS